jgi:hypothetical protein
MPKVLIGKFEEKRNFAHPGVGTLLRALKK